MNQRLPHTAPYNANARKVSRLGSLGRKTLVLVAAIVAIIPAFAASSCDSLVGQFTKAANGEPWLRIERNGNAYSARTYGHLFGKTGKKATWNDEAPTQLTLISDERLAAGAEMNGNKTPIADMCGLSGGRMIIFKVPVGYRYGQEPDEVSKTGYVMAVFADVYGYGVADLYPVREK